MGNIESRDTDKSFYSPEDEKDISDRKYITLISPEIKYGFRGLCKKNLKINDLIPGLEYTNIRVNPLSVNPIITKVKISEKLVPILDRALRKESSLCHEYYCFYTSERRHIKMLYDAYKILRHMIKVSDINMNSFIFRSSENNYFKTAEDFLKVFPPNNFSIFQAREIILEDTSTFAAKSYIKLFNNKETSPGIPKSWSDKNSMVSDTMIACVTQLDGNTYLAGECTLSMFIEETNASYVSPMSMINVEYKKYLDEEKIHEFMDEINTMWGKYGNGHGSVLSQVFIKKEHIHKYVLLCGPFGIPFCSPKDNTMLLNAPESNFDKLIIETIKSIYTPEASKVLESSLKPILLEKKNLQARIIFNEEFFNSDNAQVFNYVDNINEEDYYFDLLSIANKYLPFIKRRNIESNQAVHGGLVNF